MGHSRLDQFFLSRPPAAVRTMADSNSKLKALVEDYCFDDVRKIQASGTGTAESSFYTPLNNTRNSVGGSLKPELFCVGQLAQQGADHPNLGLFALGRCISQPRQGELLAGFFNCRKGGGEC